MHPFRFFATADENLSLAEIVGAAQKAEAVGCSALLLPDHLVEQDGALPVLAHCLDGNQNGHPAIHETFLLAQQHLALPDHMFLISDRGTHSLEHLVRLHNAGYSALCPGQWKDYRAIYDANRAR